MLKKSCTLLLIVAVCVTLVPALPVAATLEMGSAWTAEESAKTAEHLPLGPNDRGAGQALVTGLGTGVDGGPDGADSLQSAYGPELPPVIALSWLEAGQQVAEESPPVQAALANPSLQAVPSLTTSSTQPSMVSSISDTQDPGPGEAVPVSINESGFDPAYITVTEGTTVVWTNNTDQTQEVVAGGGSYQVFLPLVLRNLATGVTAYEGFKPSVQDGDAASSANEEIDWGSGPLAPGESYTYTFHTAGDFAYFMASNATLHGNVQVLAFEPPTDICGPIDQETTWTLGNVYRITCDLTVNSGVTLTVQAGAVVKFETGYSMTVQGILEARGMDGLPVIFTSIKDDDYGGDTNGDGDLSSSEPGDWRMIQVNVGGSVTIDHAILRYGGSFYSTGTVSGILRNLGTLTITNSTISHGDYNGLYHDGVSLTLNNNIFSSNNRSGALLLTRNQTSLATISNNTFNDNGLYGAAITYGNNLTGDLTGNTGTGNAYSGILVDGTISGGSLTWGAQGSDFSYVFDDLTIASDATLTLQPGVVAKGADATSYLAVYGALVALGISDNPIVFTSIKDDTYGGDTNGDDSAPAPLDWDYVLVQSGGSATLDHVILRYGGWYVTSPGYAMLINYGDLTLTNSTLSYSGYNGLYHQGEAAHIRHNEFSHNNQYGIRNGLTDVAVDARYNWWGDDSGPAPYGSGDGVYGDVEVTPWLGDPILESYNSSPGTSWSSWVAEPVNTIFGNYVYQYVDISLPARGPDFSFERTYNSKTAGTDGPLGYGWTHAYQSSATPDLTDTVVIHLGDGRQNRYLWKDDAWEAPPGVYEVLSGSLGVDLRLTFKDQTTCDFDVSGRVSAITDSNGNALSFTYSDDRLIMITMADGRQVSLTYTGDRITQIIDPAGRTVQFGYDGAGNLATVADLRGFVTTYTYDGSHQLVSITDANGHTFVHNTWAGDRVVEQLDALNNLTTFEYYTATQRTEIVDPRGSVITYTYDSAYRATGEIDSLGYSIAYEYDLSNNRIAAVDKNGHTTQYTYDDTGNVTSIVDGSGYTTTMTYDGRNNLLSRTDTREHTALFDYDANDNLIQTTDPLGEATSFGYDAYGQLVDATNERGNTTTYGYDAYGNRTIITDSLGYVATFTYDLVGRMLTDTDPRGYTTSFAYDPAGHTIAITDALGYVTRFNYDPVGNQSAMTDALGRVTAYSYDEKDRLVYETNPAGETRAFTYDSVDNRTSVTTPLDHTTSYTYDALNRMISQTDPLGHTTSYAYDGVGNQTSVTDAESHTTQFSYDSLDRLTMVTDELGGTARYAYDPAGNLVTVTDPNGHATTLTYDALNRQTLITDPLGHSTQIAYDAVGNRSVFTDANGTVVQYAYDNVDQLVAVNYPDHTDAFDYDAAGNRTMMTDTTGTTSFAYDALNHLVSDKRPSGQTVAYTCDAVGNQVTVAYPSGQTVTRTYDPADRLETVTDWAGGIATYTYDDDGRLTGQTNPNNTSVTYSYDAAGRLTAMTNSSTVAGVLSSFQYALDDVGNRIQVVDSDGTTVYSYDALYRLTDVTYPDGEQVAYAHDPAGNRTSLTSSIYGTTNFTYDAADRMLSAGGVGYTWDDNGNMLGKGTAAYTYDTANRLVEAVSAGTTISYTYDADGVRVGKNVDGSLTRYVQDVSGRWPVVLVETVDGNDTLYNYGLDLLTKTAPDGARTTYHYDGLGSTRGLTDDSGSSSAAYTYDAFGTVRSHAGSSTEFTFTGEQGDDEVGFIYMRARYYDPSVGRFTSRDPFPALAWDTQSLNRYVYVRNNPVNLVDPLGLWGISVGFGFSLDWGASWEGQIGLDIDVSNLTLDVNVTPGAGVSVSGGGSADLRLAAWREPEWADYDVTTHAGVKGHLGVGGKAGYFFGEGKEGLELTLSGGPKASLGPYMTITKDINIFSSENARGMMAITTTPLPGFTPPAHAPGPTAGGMAMITGMGSTQYFTQPPSGAK